MRGSVEAGWRAPGEVRCVRAGGEWKMKPISRRRSRVSGSAAAAALWLIGASPILAVCPPDSLQVGPACVDRFEASVWMTSNATLINRIKAGSVSLAELQKLGATQITGCEFPASCSENGSGCANLYAVSVKGVIPEHCANWFRAAAICRNSGQRLMTNQEWQVAALGTPDPGTDDHVNDCNVDPAGPGVTPTGARVSCRSEVGVYDMVGNVVEWVAEWGILSSFGNNWNKISPAFGDDVSQMGNVDPLTSIYAGLPGGVLRGGSFAISSAGYGPGAGVYAIDRNGSPASAGDGSAAGFRCGR